MIKSLIIDPYTKKQARVDVGNEVPALVVATRPLKEFENTVKFFSNSDYGSDMNVNALAGGTEIKVHDGIDSALWTGSSIVGGKFTFNSTDRANAGAQSIKVDNAAVNDTMQLAKGASQDLTGYVAISMFINVDKDWKNGDSIALYGWDTAAGLMVGNEVNLEDYFSWNTFDTWLSLIISFDDLGLTEETIDSFRIRIISAEGKSPKFYMDDIQIEETGMPINYSIKPALGTWLHIQETTFSFVATYAGTLGNATMPNIPYDNFLGVSLINGLTYSRTQDGEVLFSQTFIDLIDLLQLSGTTITGSGSDGTNTWLTVSARYFEPIILKPENDDQLSYTISDNLSTLLHMRICVGGKIEDRSQLIDV